MSASLLFYAAKHQLPKLKTFSGWLFLFLVVIENCFAEQVQDEIAVALTFGISFLLYNICFWTYGCMVYQARNVRQSDIDMNLDDSSDDSDEETQC